MMNLSGNRGFVLFISLILITLIGLFIPLLIQQQKINYRILQNRITASQNIEAVEAGLQYQLYFLKEEGLLLAESLELNSQLKVELLGEEDDNFIYLTASVAGSIPYNAELKLEKETLKIIEKKIYRSE
ncbi:MULTISPECIES: hypothetical protein [Halanaerobium]|uniref:Uncharacterized protein n=1 Tax=Halanaerobium saccharolyticum TaxID=43595 RepID=A0A4R6SAM2_9FIRM|nr:MULTISPECIES: hypothetical protein [Halanaerobium]TDP96980.1 hypothetical protein C7957_10675 [Halanaerobium saccharolyticum]